MIGNICDLNILHPSVFDTHITENADMFPILSYQHTPGFFQYVVRIVHYMINFLWQSVNLISKIVFHETYAYTRSS